MPKIIIPILIVIAFLGLAVVYFYNGDPGQIITVPTAIALAILAIVAGFYMAKNR